MINNTSHNSIAMNLAFTTLIIASSLITFTSSLNNFPIAKPDCPDHCGGVRIPYPFGTKKGCHATYSFLTTCDETHDPPKLYLQNVTSMEITEITLSGQLTIMQFISHDCYAKNETRVSYNNPFIELPISLLVNSTANKFTIVGCDTYGFVFGRRLDRDYQTGCTAMCYARDDMIEGSCTGLGCCQTSIPKDVWRVDLSLYSYGNYSRVWDFNNCSYAFLVKEGAFNFSSKDLTRLRDVPMLPMVADWAMGNGTCEEAKKNASSYECRSGDSVCYKPDNGYGYRCSCIDGYEGNPYLSGGCNDIDECTDNLHNCEKDEYCKNEPGKFSCKCPKGYRGDGIKGGRGCYRGESLVFKLTSGISLGVIILMLAACLLYMELKRRRLVRTRQKLFLQNGGKYLQENLVQKGTSRIFGEVELKRATDDFHRSMIIGQGGFGTVYKGFLQENNRAVAIKKSKQVDPNVVNPKQVEQFLNEVTVLSQINHRNVVEFLGCCVETAVPLLVFEFVANGTLFEHIHDRAKSRFLTWDLRLRIAAEAAGVLSYLHSSTLTPIVHRDVKSANILLDSNFTAKVSDFGASKLVPLDQTQLTTMVQGTFGYLDPEYLQTSQLTEKSDVYSFGVVLAELLTGMKALSYDRPEMEENLANFFISAMKQDRLFSVLDGSVVSEPYREKLFRVALLAKSCLCLRGEDRPTMKDVAMELEAIRHEGKHSWDQGGNDNDDEGKSLLGFSGIVGHEGNGMSSAAFDSFRSNIGVGQHSGR